MARFSGVPLAAAVVAGVVVGGALAASCSAGDAGEASSLLQHLLVAASTVAGRPQHKAAGGPDSSADADDNYGIVCVSDFVPYVGDDGGFDVSGHVWMRSIPDGPQEITLRLKGVDPRCSGGPGDAPGSCGVRVHEGSSCGAGTGGSLYHQSRARDPWACVAYTSTHEEDGTVSGIGRFPVATGLTSDDIDGHALVVYDFEGRRTSCAVVGGGLLAKFPSPEQPRFTMSAGAFVNKAGFVVSGLVSFAFRKEATPAASVLDMSYRLEGVDPACAGGPGSSKYSCGMIVTKETTCLDSPSDTLYDAAEIRMDPWRCPAYTAVASLDSEGFSARGDYVPVSTGLQPDAILGHTVFLHDFAGRPISCGVVSVISG